MKFKTVCDLRKVEAGLADGAFVLYKRVLHAVCQDHAGEWAFDKAAGLIRNDDIDRLLAHADFIAAQKYADAASHFAANQLSLLVRKYPFPEGMHSCTPEVAAKKKFWAAEHKCLRVNQRFLAFGSCRSPYESDLQKMRGFIAYVLGYEVPLNRIWQSCDFGPGANMGIHGNATNSSRKIGAKSWSVSPSAFEYGNAAMKDHRLLFELLCSTGHRGGICYSHDPELFNAAYAQRCTVTTYNKIAFVPKTAKIHRSIAVEPLVNGFLQKGIGDVMRGRLARVGIDLSDQNLNAVKARKGSAEHDGVDPYVTLDLSSASDSIATELVRSVLPPAWFDFLNATRSKSFLLDGNVFRQHKFCSMGNGFCFPLQSLIFSAACIAAGAKLPGHDFCVYGDDIVVRTSVAERLVTLLGVLGFTLNRDKSFFSGPFRESCGSDWFAGADVRPFTLDYAFDTVPNIFKFVNLTQRSPRTEGFFRNALPIVKGALPERWQFMRPHKGNADTAMTVPLDEFMTNRHARWNTDWHCWSWSELQASPLVDSEWKESVHRDLYLEYGVLRGATSVAPFTWRRKTRYDVRRVAHAGSSCSWIPGTTLTARKV